MKEKQQKNDDEKLKKADDKKKQEPDVADLVDSLQRLQAEFENYKKRIDKEKQESIAYAKADVIVKLLPILDSIELALKNTSDKDEFVKGVEIIFAQFYSALKAEGLKPIECLGKCFDPYKHEVLLKQESDKDEDIVLEELQRGYMLNNMVIRPSKVKVSKKKECK